MSHLNKTALLPRSLKLLAAMGSALAIGGMAHAQSTDAGRTVSNTFTLDYSVNDVPQTQITNEDGTPGDADGPTVFTVDRLIDLTVVQSAPAVVVAPGTLAADAVLTFSVTNTGNDNQSYSLSVDDIGGDDFNFVPGTQVITVSIPALPDGTPAQTLTLAETSLGDATTPDFTPDIPAGTTFTVTIAGEIPDTAENNDIEDLALVVETRDPTAFAFETTTPVAGTLTTAENGGTNDIVNAAQNIFADGDSDETAAFPSGDIDIIENGVAHDVGRFVIATPNVTGEKNRGCCVDGWGRV